MTEQPEKPEEAFELSPLDPEIDAALCAYIDERKASMPDRNYF